MPPFLEVSIRVVLQVREGGPMLPSMGRNGLYPFILLSNTNINHNILFANKSTRGLNGCEAPKSMKIIAIQYTLSSGDSIIIL